MSSLPLSRIILGAGALNTQYNIDQQDDVKDLLKYAFENGINTIDTAAFYGPSEILLGQALAQLPQFKREDYYLCSKACRWETNQMEFSRDGVRRSVERSLKRLGTTYLDVLYIHDVEFGEPVGVLEAINAAFELKEEKVVRNVGISGLPLDVLAKVAKLVNLKLEKNLDFVLSYCNLTLQNNLLLTYEPKLKECGVSTIINASPLSMSLLREEATHAFHPAGPELRDRADSIGSSIAAKKHNYASVALQYAFNAWKNKPTVLGMRTVDEIKVALQDLKLSADPSESTKQLWTNIIADFGEFHNYVWQEEVPKTVRHHWDAIQ